MVTVTLALLVLGRSRKKNWICLSIECGLSSLKIKILILRLKQMEFMFGHYSLKSKCRSIDKHSPSYCYFPNNWRGNLAMGMDRALLTKLFSSLTFYFHWKNFPSLFIGFHFKPPFPLIISLDSFTFTLPFGFIISFKVQIM